MTVKGGSRPACAACRFQRRRCSSDCPLAPYFPANNPKLFHDVHRVYGVGNIMKILNQLKDEEQKQDAMKSITYESYIRQVNRVHGCYGLILQYQQKCVEKMQELQYVRHLLDTYKKNNKQGSHPVHNEINDQILPIINGGNDPGFFYNGLSDHNYANEPPRFDEFPLYTADHGERSQDYTGITSGSFVDVQQSFMETKEAYYDLNLESSLTDTKDFIELEELKPNEDLLEVQQGVHRMTMGL